MKTIEEASKMQGVSLESNNCLRIHFSSLPNWYGCYSGVDCPVCENKIDWDYGENLPSITTEYSTKNIKPKVIGGQLVHYGHRFLKIYCDKCGVVLFVENFD